MIYAIAVAGLLLLFLIAVVMEDMLDERSHDERAASFGDVRAAREIDAPRIGELRRERERLVPA